jgi:hypothetical protein
MNLSTPEAPNSKEIIQEHVLIKKITWAWPLLIVLARLIFAILAQALVSGLFILQGHPTPWQAAGH